MKKYRPLKLIASLLNGFAWVGIFLGSVSLVAVVVQRIVYDMPFDRSHLAFTSSMMLGCLAAYAIAQTVFLLLNIYQKLQESS